MVRTFPILIFNYYQKVKSPLHMIQYVLCLVAPSCLTFCDPMTVAHQAPLSMGHTRAVRQTLLQGIFPNQGSNPGLPHCRRILYHLSRQGSPLALIHRHKEKLEESPCHSQSCQEERDRKCLSSSSYLQFSSVQSLSRVRLFSTP